MRRFLGISTFRPSQPPARGATGVVATVRLEKGPDMDARKVVVLVAVAVICGVLIEVDPENETVG